MHSIMDGSVSTQNELILPQTDLYIMGQWRNGGIDGKTIAPGIDVTVSENIMDGTTV